MQHKLASLPSLFVIEMVCVFLATPFLLQSSTFNFVAYAFSVIIVTLWVVQSFKYGIAITLETPLSILWIGLAFFVFVGVVVSVDRDLAIPDALIFLLGFAWWRLLIRFSREFKSEIPGILTFITFGLAITILGSLNVEIPNKIPFLQNITSGWNVNQVIAQGGSINANSIAATLLLYHAFLISLLLTGVLTSKFQRVAISILVLTGYFVMLFTQSRGGWIASAAQLILMILLVALLKTGVGKGDGTKDKARFIPIATFAIAIVVLVGMSLIVVTNDWGIFEDLQSSGVLGSFSSLEFRNEVWRWAIVAIQDFPITGTGFNSFRRVAHRLYPIAIPSAYDIGHAHNQFLQVTVDTGIVGVMLYSAMLINSVWMSIRLQLGNKLQSAIGTGAIATLLGFFIWGLSDALALGAKPMLLYWMLLGLVTGAFEATEKSKSRPEVK